MFMKKKKSKIGRSGLTDKQAKDLARLAKKMGSKTSIKRVNKEQYE
ncbi:hypothetical protein ACFYKX_25590 [Cytobacillus sp. FJAT-54145]|uniref:Uncharacterized protein n=1 Tax=Cytobacillus spartinae TaxID=3299023 RepID=A0ABW6KM84_9BACI